MRRRGLILFFLGLLGGVLLASCGGTAEPFDFDSDDLCSWVSAEEVAGFVEEAFGWEATAVAVEPDDEYWECKWAVTGSDGEDRMVYATEAEWFNFNGGPIYLSEREVVDFADLEEPFVPIMGAVSGHPSLDERVVVINGGFGSFAFGVPPTDQYLQVSVHTPDSEDWESFEPNFFPVANSFIEELGWLPATST